MTPARITDADREVAHALWRRFCRWRPGDDSTEHSVECGNTACVLVESREVERRRIKTAQAPALRNLLVLVGSCSTLCPVWGGGHSRHAEDCERGIVLAAVRTLRAATRGPK